MQTISFLHQHWRPADTAGRDVRRICRESNAVDQDRSFCKRFSPALLIELMG